LDECLHGPSSSQEPDDFGLYRMFNISGVAVLTFLPISPGSVVLMCSHSISVL
jgi:hypothetical protein